MYVCSLGGLGTICIKPLASSVGNKPPVSGYWEISWSVDDEISCSGCMIVYNSVYISVDNSMCVSVYGSISISVYVNIGKDNGGMG